MSSIEATKHDGRGRPTRDTRWRARFRDVNGRSRSRTFDRKIDAERFVASTTTDMARGDWVDPRSTRIRFDELADSWWATTVKLAPTTRRGYWQLLENHVRPYFGTRVQGSIDWAEVEGFIAEKLTAGHSPKRVRDMVSIVSAVMKRAVRARVAARQSRGRSQHPGSACQGGPRRGADDGRSPAARRPHPRPVPARRVDAGASWITSRRAVRPARRRGSTSHGPACTSPDAERRAPPRRREADPCRGPHEVDRRRPSAPMPAWLRDDLAAMLAGRDADDRAPSAPLFRAVKGLGRLEVPMLRDHVIRPALVAAGLPESFRTYDLRHTHASLLIEQGANPLEVAQRMGHTDASITLRVYGYIFGRFREVRGSWCGRVEL